RRPTSARPNDRTNCQRILPRALQELHRIEAEGPPVNQIASATAWCCAWPDGLVQGLVVDVVEPPSADRSRFDGSGESASNQSRSCFARRKARNLVNNGEIVRLHELSSMNRKAAERFIRPTRPANRGSSLNRSIRGSTPSQRIQSDRWRKARSSDSKALSVSPSAA